MGGLPFRTQTGFRADAAASAAAETNARLAVLREQRNKLLLEDNDSEASKLAVEIAEQERLALGYVDKERLLREQDEREAHEKRLRENEAKNKRIDALFDLRGEDIAKLAALEQQRVKLWRAVLSTNRKIVAAHSWSAADLSACLLAPLASNTALAHESYRISYTARRYGGHVEAPDAGHSLPGSRCPRVEWAEDPERIRPLKDVFAEAAEFGKARLRGKDGTAVNGAPIVNGVPQQAIADSLRPGGGVQAAAATNGDDAPAANGQDESLPRTEAERQLGIALKELNKAAEDNSPEGEARYKAKLEEVTQLQDAVAAGQKVGAQQNG
jgi:hypothetical protein